MKYYAVLDSELGPITVQVNDEGVLGIWFEQHTTRPDELGTHNPTHPLLVQTACELKQYFAGERQTFTLPLAPVGTEFQRKVWQALCAIPYGEAISYQELANRIGNPKAVRAVGTANGKNPLSIVVPCHRVVGKNGKLSGYAGGVERKLRLLNLESVML
ncbi:methylated-DNA--[protein]-cysteine S-methyltransferase [Vibrio sp. 10N]|uniref:methylated-DNA--[protein]-cysteine S-methyltransferase n=1 Tax=Vibrio sp. 10N TaxID=3058938 RepID=UPI002813EDD1|nr:methylated-DNA--[protein]-cysteine S-methyltransferase [Vibrio sp. 10N]